MKPFYKLIVALVLTVLASLGSAALPAPGTAGAPTDVRYCGEPARSKNGEIKRSRAALREFSRNFPCPSTLNPSASCPNWAVDHVIPLSSGGCDTPVNMAWMPDKIKSCRGSVCKDRWERSYHSLPRQKVSGD